MTPSLSVILPVSNAEDTLPAVVPRLLEVLPDLAPRFEIMIVDDASTDQTAEIADDLRRTYPQVRVVRHGWPWGLPAALRTGRSHCRGNTVLVLDRHDAIGVRELARQWQVLRKEPVDSREDASSDRHETEPRRWARSEPAHTALSAPRETSFLRHLRQLSMVEPR